MDTHFLPPWAERQAEPGEYVEGTQLSTRDGRKTGNAVVSKIIFLEYQPGVNTYEVITDAGSKMVLHLGELQELFYDPAYVMEKNELSLFLHKDAAK